MLAGSCVKDRNFEAPIRPCTVNTVANTSYDEVKNLFVDETIQIQEDMIIEGYVVSSDKEGNFFNTLHFQDQSDNPGEGFQIEIDVRDSHLFYPVGSKIYIKLKGLYLGKSKDVFKIGGVFTSFGNVSVGRLPRAVVDEHIVVSCEEAVVIRPKELEISEIQDSHTNTLIRIKGVQVVDEEVNLPFARSREETERTLIDCGQNEIIMLNSGFADFQAEVLPNENGYLSGVLLRENNNYFIAIRTLQDLVLDSERCDGSMNEITTQNILISELADPENNTGARFVELYNSNAETISLKGWMLIRYTNDNVEIGSSIDLSEYEIFAESTLVIASDAEEFNVVYGFVPDSEGGKNSPADSNGDDNIQLIDPFGRIIDTFGIVGEDGSGTNHEFEDGRALRKPEISQGSTSYNFNEWVIFNDTGENGTIDNPQIAPDDFSPGTRE